MLDIFFEEMLLAVPEDGYTNKPKKYVWLPPDLAVCRVCKGLKLRDSVTRAVCDQCAAVLREQYHPTTKPCITCGEPISNRSKVRYCPVCKEKAMLRNAETAKLRGKETHKKRMENDEAYREKMREQARIMYRKIQERKGKDPKTHGERIRELLAYYATDPLKRCPCCKEEKRLSEFERDVKSLSGAGTYCRVCSNKKYALRIQRKRERESPARLQAKIEAMQIADLLAPINAEIRQERKRELKKKYKKKRREDPVHRLHRSMSEHMRSMLRGVPRTGWRHKAGWTKDELITHLKKQFQEGMSFDNYGEWHVDHIKPKALFDITSIEDPEFKECWGLGNLQPLWASENCSKGAKYFE